MLEAEYDNDSISETKIYEEALKTVQEKYNCNVSGYEFPINQLVIENRYIYATTSGRWMVKGEWTWYRSKSLEHFMENYVLSTDNAKDFNLYIAVGILNSKHKIPRTKLNKLTGISVGSIRKHSMTYLAGGYETKENHPQVQKIVAETLEKAKEEYKPVNEESIT